MFTAESYAALTKGEQHGFGFAHAPKVARTLLELEAMEPTWHVDDLSFPPRYGRYSADEPIFGWSIPRSSAFFLYSLILATEATHALEVGTSFAYSTIWLASALSRTGGQITTCETFEKKIEIARQSIKRSGLNNISLVTEDAAAFMRKTIRKFDFVFLDADATEYVSYLPWLTKNIGVNGILAMDNTLTHEAVVSDFVNQIQVDPHWAVWFWPYDHGLMLARRTNPPT
jgi:predicted O-methyltransferase YrrM